MSKKVIASAIAAVGIMCSGAASAVVIHGVNFGNAGKVSHIDTTTIAETYISGNDQELFGYGQVSTVNGALNYAGGNSLYFVFDKYISNDYSQSLGTVDFSGGEIRVYLMPTFNLLDFSSEVNFAAIDSGTPWLVLSGHALFPENATSPDTLRGAGIFTGAAISFGGSGLLDVTGGYADVMAYLDTDTRPDAGGGLADILINTSGSNDQLNPLDDTRACRTGGSNTRATNWCIAGSADLRGATNVPEPGVLALVGLGLLGLGAARRKSLAK